MPLCLPTCKATTQIVVSGCAADITTIVGYPVASSCVRPSIIRMPSIIDTCVLEWLISHICSKIDHARSRQDHTCICIKLADGTVAHLLACQLGRLATLN